MELKKLDLIEAENLLKHIDSGCERETWLRVLAGLYTEFGDNAKPIAERWSATSDKFNKSNFNSTWKSLKSGRVNIGTVIKLAHNGGYRFPDNPKKKTDSKVISSLFEAVESCCNDEATDGLAEYMEIQSPCNTVEKQKIDDEAEEKQKNIKAFHELWEESKPCNYHEYLEKKGIKNHGWRISDKGNLLIPVFNANEELTGLQRIFKVNGLNFETVKFAKIFCKGSSYTNGE